MTQTAPKKRNFGLLPQIVVAIVLGVVLGQFLPDWLTRVFVTFNGLFGEFLNFIIPLIILGLIAPAIAELGKGAGRWLAITAAIAYTSTIIAGLLGWGTSMLVLPRVLPEGGAQSLANPEESLLEAYFVIEMPPLFGVMSALVFAFIIGVALTAIKGDVILRGATEFRDIINLVIAKILIPLLPLYIFGIFLNMAQSGQVFTIIATFLGVVVFVFSLTWVMLILQYGVAGAVSKRNPFKMLGTMLPAYATALGTSSSAASIPVTLRQAIKMGVSQPVASFVIPLSATIHLAGSTIKLTCFTLAIMMLYGMEIVPMTILGFILMLGVFMIAAPGVPGGAVMTALGLMQTQLGFDPTQQALMIATYIAIDSFGTATNVTGDGAIAMLVDKLIGKKRSDDKVSTSPLPRSAHQTAAQ
ncbi:MAG: dicarboxylate/amino acid:cation symporter [Propionibacterium sp.]|nr:dicarboxylate/amino acid:cation symporter [Propionibacterium sp.]